MICGTGTGGFVANFPSDRAPRLQPYFSRIIALMLGRLRMSVSDAIKHYDTVTMRVFSTETKFVDDTFKASTLEAVIKDIVEGETGDRESYMLDTFSRACKTYVSCSYPVLGRN